MQVIASGERDEEIAGVRIHRTGPADTMRGLVSRALAYRRFIGAAQAWVQGHASPGMYARVQIPDPTGRGGARMAEAVRAVEAMQILR